MLGFKLNHVSKRGHCDPFDQQRLIEIMQLMNNYNNKFEFSELINDYTPRVCVYQSTHPWCELDVGLAYVTKVAAGSP